jgi:hypothetical protein
MTDTASRSRIRALTSLAIVALGITTALLVLASRIGHFAGSWLVLAVREHSGAVVIGLMWLSGLSLVALSRNHARGRNRRSV